MNEWEFIEKIKSQALANESVALGIGDDCAITVGRSTQTLMACDTILEGKHFLLNEASPEAIAYKSIAVNISDLAAMAAIPETLLLSVSIPKYLPEKFLERFVSSMLETCQEYKIAIIGGDTTSWDYGLAICVTMTGRPIGDHPVLRSGAKEGDIIAVTGSLGNSLERRHHLNFTPRLSESAEIFHLLNPTSMIDISDGLAGDLAHICRASKISARIDESSIPIHDSLASLPKHQALKHAWSDGEDFELCFSFPKEKLPNFKKLNSQATIIGEFTSDGPLIHNLDLQAIELQGYQHRW